ncbi:hypothetical protein BC938DRAFT_472124 [Jimgerdemannia flammicorona]|uniref:Tyrosine specific protein phosphatases domain-containing protein n=1 Tax=Jimgerdemannia flammicorona TaxID=994334 RepID=A0A433QU53_9FUNG|nr:hypothetical protein BC938DRAFT_472124 [Jimgerdemannia flammicorona]
MSVPPIVWGKTLLFLLLASTAIVAVLAGVEPLNYDRIHLVDYSKPTNTYLFRGNLPETLNPPVFAYDALVSYLVNRSALEGPQFQAPTLTTPIELHIITLLNHTDPSESDALNTEMSFALNHTDLIAELVWWELGGETLAPADQPPVTRDALARTFRQWDYDKLPDRIELLNKKVHGASSTSTKKNIVWYFHCGHGQDRTGELSGAYNLRWMNQTYAQVVAYNNALGWDVPQNQHAMEWYSLWLNATGGV